MACVKLHILEQQYKHTDLKVSYINKKLTLNNSVPNQRKGILVKHIDPDGEFPLLSNLIGAAGGAIFEYGSQVVSNVINEGGVKLSVFTTNIDLADIGVAAFEGGITSGGSVIKSAAAKVTVSVVSSVVKNTIDATVEDGIETKKDVGKIAANTAIDMVGEGAGKLMGKLVPKCNVKLAKITSGNKEVLKARQKAAPNTLTKQQADNARRGARVKNDNANKVSKTLSNTPKKMVEDVVGSSVAKTIQEDYK